MASKNTNIPFGDNKSIRCIPGYFNEDYMPKVLNLVTSGTALLLSSRPEWRDLPRFQPVKLNPSPKLGIILLSPVSVILSKAKNLNTGRIKEMKRKIYIGLFILCIAVAAVSGWHFFGDQIDFKRSTDFYNSLSDKYVKAGPFASAKAEDSLPDAETDDPDATPTPTQPPKVRTTDEQPPITVDFAGLKELYPDLVAWIYSEGTNINFPVLQGKNNTEYLKYTPDRKSSDSGSIFIDCENEPDFSDDNTLMYGHNRKNGMFSSILNYSKQEYYEEHPYMWLLTPDANYRVDVFAGFVTDSSSWAYAITFNHSDHWYDFIYTALKASGCQAHFIPEYGDHLLTLSTCEYSFDNARYLLMGVLTKSIPQE